MDVFEKVLQAFKTTFSLFIDANTARSGGFQYRVITSGTHALRKADSCVSFPELLKQYPLPHLSFLPCGLSGTCFFDLCIAVIFRNSRSKRGFSIYKKGSRSTSCESASCTVGINTYRPFRRVRREQQVRERGYRPQGSRWSKPEQPRWRRSAGRNGSPWWGR